jgi:iron complex outermembrane receptor protein
MKSLAAWMLAALAGLPLAAQAPSGKTYAQKLVDETVAKHRELLILVMHVTPPNSSENIIIASNIGRIGKKADEDDLRVIDTGKTNLEVNEKGDHFEVELVLQDQAGKTIGALGTVYAYKAGDDKAKLQRTAEQTRDELRKQIPSKESLFEMVH